MKLEWKGNLKSYDQLPVGNLPKHAVKFKEPDSIAKLNIVAALFIIPVIIVVVLAILIKSFITGGEVVIEFFNFWGILLVFLTILPHELLHAIAFPKGAKVELWLSLKHVVAFVISTDPISKRRFIFLSLLPNLVFGFLPLVIWIFLPQELAITGIIFTFAALSLTLGCGDYLNVWNASIQMPKGSVQQLSGMNSYWYMPENSNNDIETLSSSYHHK